MHRGDENEASPELRRAFYLQRAAELLALAEDARSDEARVEFSVLAAQYARMANDSSTDPQP